MCYGSVSDFSDVNNVDMKVCGACGTRDPDDPYSREVTAAHMVNTMNFRVYKLGSMNFRVLGSWPTVLGHPLVNS